MRATVNVLISISIVKRIMIIYNKLTIINLLFKEGVNSMSVLFSSPGKYIQGSGELSNLGKYTKEYGKKMLLITDQFLLDKFIPKSQSNF